MKPAKIKELRIRAGWSQTELGKKIDVSAMTVSNWENRKSTPSTEQLEELARILGSGDPGAENANASPIAAWVSKARISKGMSIPELANRADITPPALYRIESGGTRNLRSSTRKKLEKILGAMPDDAAAEAADEAAISGLGSLEDFDPHSDDERPSGPGIYVFYDISDRPIYVGQSGNVRKRIREHFDAFWFKRPIVENASWIKVEDQNLRRQIEEILIKFLKSNAVINKQHVDH